MQLLFWHTYTYGKPLFMGHNHWSYLNCIYYLCSCSPTKETPPLMETFRTVKKFFCELNWTACLSVEKKWRWFRKGNFRRGIRISFPSFSLTFKGRFRPQHPQNVDNRTNGQTTLLARRPRHGTAVRWSRTHAGNWQRLHFLHHPSDSLQS